MLKFNNTDNYFFFEVNNQRMRMKSYSYFVFLIVDFEKCHIFLSSQYIAGYNNRKSKAIHLGINQTEFRVFLVKCNWS